MFKKLYLSCCLILCLSNVLFAELPLELPPVVYAVPGIETNIYFDNLVLTVNSNNYIFDVDCSKGRNDAKRWRFIPTDKDIGSYTWRLRVFNSENKIVATGVTKIIVSPKNSGAGKKKSLLIIGDSLTYNSVYPARIYNLMSKSGNPKLTLIGSHSGALHDSKSKIIHEGYGGWRWSSFCTTWTNKKSYRAKSKFLTLKNGKPTLDFKSYVKKYANGKNPDFVTIMLGTNDVFQCKDENIESSIKSRLSYADKFITEIRKSAPDAKIGIALTVPPAYSQDAGGSNYRCSQTRWQYRRNQFKLVEAMIKKYGHEKIKNISLIPAFAGLDCENNYPVQKEKINKHNPAYIMRQSNGVHPATSGYKQIADVFYCWLKYQLSK